MSECVVLRSRASSQKERAKVRRVQQPLLDYIEVFSHFRFGTGVANFLREAWLVPTGPHPSLRSPFRIPLDGTRASARFCLLPALLALVACSGTVGSNATVGTQGRVPDAGKGTDAGIAGDGGVSDAGTGRTNDAFPATAIFYQDISAAALAATSSQTISHLAAVGWGSGEMQIDFSITILHADVALQPRVFTPANGYYTPDCDMTPVPVPPGGMQRDRATMPATPRTGPTGRAIATCWCTRQPASTSCTTRQSQVAKPTGARSRRFAKLSGT